MLPVIQFELSGEKLKLEFWKTCIYSPVLDSFPILKDVFAKANGNVISASFLMKCVGIWNICITW